MEHPFGKKIEGQIRIAAMKRYPNEMCGFIIGDDFVEMENIAEDPVQDFRIDEKEYLRKRKTIKSIIHSHADFPHLSKTDMRQQIASKLPWGVAFLIKGVYMGMLYFGDQVEPYPLKERQFVHGAWDCYGLLRDYFRIERNATIPIFPRDDGWWDKEPSMLKDGCIEAGFQYIDMKQAVEGDIFFMQLRAPVVNHCGIYLGEGQILHHLYGRLSREEPLGRWTKYITDWLRFVGYKK